VDLHDGSIRLTTTGQNLSQLAGRIVFHHNWLELQELHARDERGTLRLSGGVGLDGWTPRRLRLAVTMKKFPLRREGAEMASVTAEALLQATIAPSHMGMDLGFSSLAIQLPDDAGRTLQELDEHPDLEVMGRTRPTLLSTKREIGIRIHSARPFWVRRSDFSALVDSDLNIAYSAAELAIGGYVEFNRGVFDVFGKSFNLERGSIRFDGSGNVNPELNLIAVHDPHVAGSSPVRVTVTGRMSAPDVTFSAQGCADESGALSLLLTGKCSLGDSSGPDSNPDAQRAAFVGGLLAGVLTLGAKSQLGALIPVIGMESTGQGFNQRIRAGIDADTLVPKFLRPIVRRAYVEGAVTTGTENQDGTTGPASVAFLLELYFPHNFVGAGRVKPGSAQVQWGVDVTWEP
jgi:translocation and assembly module TamB